MGTAKKRKSTALNVNACFSNESEEPYTTEGGHVEEKKIWPKHGRLVNALEKKLRQNGVTAFNRNLKDIVKPDLLIPQKAVIELKAGSSWVDVYCAIGQAAVYSRVVRKAKNNDIIRIVVFPARTEKCKIAILREEGIVVVKWHMKKNRIIFSDLEDVLARINHY